MGRVRYIDNYDTVNGFWGVAVSVWFQGCPHMCKGCFNPETWNWLDESVKTRENDDIVKEILDELDRYYPKTLSFLGGEPLAPYNREDLQEIIKCIKNIKPDLKIALWTGYEWEEIKDFSIIKNIDVIVTGKYIEDKHCEYKRTKNLIDKKRGSSNQRVIDVKESLRNGQVVTKEDI